MSCRADLPVVLERWRRFRRALKAEEQPTMGVIMAALEKNEPAMFDNQDDPLEAAMGRRGEARDHRRAGRGQGAAVGGARSQRECARRNNQKRVQHYQNEGAKAPSISKSSSSSAAILRRHKVSREV